MLENFASWRQIGCWSAGTARRQAAVDASRLQPGQAGSAGSACRPGPVIGCNKLEPMVSG
jgi:hypothetical protein